MELTTFVQIEGLVKRLQARGFSWQHWDYMALRDALPEMLERFKTTQPDDKEKECTVGEHSYQDMPICVHCGHQPPF